MLVNTVASQPNPIQSTKAEMMMRAVMWEIVACGAGVVKLY